ncbi:hypothetical protein IMZ48_47250, partial [Candidatus Bathyarchaeota archaeon]|nr:hypothetical protein [Candidatus Bathyarchaeota archaeon]
SMLSPRRVRPQTVEVVDAGDLAILSEMASPPPERKAAVNRHREEPAEPEDEEPTRQALVPEPVKREKRRSTIFCPQEGIFRTVSQQQADALEEVSEDEAHAAGAQEEEEPTEQPEATAPAPTSMYARTPSADPPTFALLAQERSSLMSLLNAPLNDERESDAHELPAIPTMQAPEGRLRHSAPPDEESTTPDASPAAASNSARPHTAASFYTVTTKTRVPTGEKRQRPPSVLHRGQRPPSRADELSFDANNPAMTPTMTREQALAQIRERRAQSAALGTATPRRRMGEGVARREMSAPTGRAAKTQT